jgi:hypothetical protein
MGVMMVGLSPRLGPPGSLQVEIELRRNTARLRARSIVANSDFGGKLDDPASIEMRELLRNLPHKVPRSVPLC